MTLSEIESKKDQLSESESQWLSDIVWAEREEEDDDKASWSHHDLSEFHTKHQMMWSYYL